MHDYISGNATIEYEDLENNFRELGFQKAVATKFLENLEESLKYTTIFGCLSTRLNSNSRSIKSLTAAETFVSGALTHVFNVQGQFKWDINLEDARKAAERIQREQDLIESNEKKVALMYNFNQQMSKPGGLDCREFAKKLALHALEKISHLPIEEIYKKEDCSKILSNTAQKISSTAATGLAMDHIVLPIIKSKGSWEEFLKLCLNGNSRDDFINFYNEAKRKGLNHTNIPPELFGLKIFDAVHIPVIKQVMAKIGQYCEEHANNNEDPQKWASLVMSAEFAAFTNLVFKIVIAETIYNVLKEKAQPGSHQQTEHLLDFVKNWHDSVQRKDFTREERACILLQGPIIPIPIYNRT